MDFQRLAGMIEGIQANLAVLTGGKSEFDTSQLEAMKKLGSSSFVVRTEGPVLVVDSHTSAVKKG